MDPEVVDTKNVTIEWNTPPDESGLIAFLVKEKGFSEVRVRNGLEALKKARRTKPQGRLDSFFKASPKTTPASQAYATAVDAAASFHSNVTHTGAENATSPTISTDHVSTTATAAAANATHTGAKNATSPSTATSAAAETALKKRAAPSNTQSKNKKVKQ